MKNVATPSATETTARKTASPLRLLATAAGGPRQWRDKLARLAGTVALYASQREIDRRLARLAERGYLTQIPTRAQLGFGGLDMVQFFIVPGAADYYETQGIDFRFHQVLRFLDDPVSVIDPVGLLSRRDTIIGHLMQVTHANPIYDLQILDMFDDGLEALERELEQMLAGTHPRAGTIGAIVEDPSYHRRLLDYVRTYRANPDSPHLLREQGRARSSAEFRLAEHTFGTLPAFMRYANRLPRSLGALLAHRRRRVLDPTYCDPEPAAAYRAGTLESPYRRAA